MNYLVVVLTPISKPKAPQKGNAPQRGCCASENKECRLRRFLDINMKHWNVILA